MSHDTAGSGLIDVAVVGATGIVGEAILELLAERDFPLGNIHALASERSAGQTVNCGKRKIEVESPEGFKFSRVRICFFSASNDVARQYVPQATAAGCVVIDASSCFRQDEDVPLVVVGINPERIADYPYRRIIATPSASSMALAVALKPLRDTVGLERVNVVTYQSVSSVGRGGIGELASQTAQLLNGRSVEPARFSRQIAFNVLPQAGDFNDAGHSSEELQLVREVGRILDDPGLRISPTCAIVPVFYGHCQAVHVETLDAISASQARSLWNAAAGISVVDGLGENAYPTPVGHATDNTRIHIGRIRQDICCDRGLNFWLVSDNLRAVSALNCVQVAEHLIESHL